MFITVYHRRKADWDPTHFMKLFLFLYVRCQVRRHCFAGCGENSKLLGSRHVNKNQRREGCRRRMSVGVVPDVRFFIKK